MRRSESRGSPDTVGVYLDANAAMPIHPAAREAMEEFVRCHFGNASSVHRFGARARAAIEQARCDVADAVGAEPAEIIFTSGGTESNNLALFGLVRDDPRPHLVVSPLEHLSVLEPVWELERRGATVTWLPVDGEGRIDPGDLRAALRPNTRLVSIGWGNNEIGTIQDIAALAEICSSRGVPLHVDAVQAFSKIPVTVRALDLCSFSAHKIGGPMGTGALFVRRDIELRPLLFGGGQERGLRSGTENIMAVVGFGAAVRLGVRFGRHTEELRERLWAGLARCEPVIRNSPRRDCLPNTLNVQFVGVRGEDLVAGLDLEGIAVSLGSACAAGAGKPSHVLRAIGRTAREARDGVRFALTPDTTEQEIDATIAAVERVVRRIRNARFRQITASPPTDDD